MSFDLQLPTECNHKIFKELGILDDGRRLLRVSKPIASMGTVGVFASGNVVPSTLYEIVGDPRTVRVNQPRVIQFRDKWKSPDDLFEVTYVTISSYCPKCAGLNVIDDISYNVKGGLNVFRDEKLLIQNLEKFTVTELNSNSFHSFIGTSLVTLLGEKIIDTNFLVTRITQEISNSLNKFLDLQEQYRQTGRTLTEGESLESVDNIEVIQDEDDPTILRADVTVTARSGKTAEFSQTLRIAEG